MISKFTLCMLGAATVAAVDIDASMNALTKMRSLSSTLYAHEHTGPLTNAGPAILDDLAELSELVDEVPGLSWIIDQIWPGDSDTKEIEEQLAAIKQELDQMHAEMIEEWQEIMNAFGLVYCATDMLKNEQNIYSAWTDFKDWMGAINDSSRSKAYCDSMKGFFITDCDGNQCLDAARYTLNGLSPEGSFPSLSCDMLQAMYNSSGLSGYEGFRDYIATKGAMLLVEGLMGVIMETVYILETEVAKGLTPEEALEISNKKFGTWMIDSCTRLKDFINKAYNEAETTRPHNEAHVKVVKQVADHQTAANNVHAELKMIYPWNNWAVAVADYNKNSCYNTYRCDDKVSCSYDHAKNNDDIYIVQVPSTWTAPIPSFQNQERWDYWTSYGEMCSVEVRDDIHACGCGGGSIVTRKHQNMKVAFDRADVWKWVDAHDQQVLAWANRTCTCSWPHCNAAPSAYFLQ